MTAARKSSPTRKTTKRKVPAPKRASTSSRSKSQARTSTKWLHLSGMATVILGFCSLLLLRLANAPQWDAVTLGYLELSGAAILTWLIFAGVSLSSTAKSTDLQLLMLPTAFLVGFGILIQHRIKGIDIFAPTISDFAYPTGIAILLITLFLCRQGRFRWLAIPGTLYMLLSLVGMITLLLLGQRFRGAIFAAGRMTPTELLKPLMAIYASAFLAEHLASNRRGLKNKPRQSSGIPSWIHWLVFAGLWAMLMGLLAYQRDLGMIMILNGMLVLTVFAGTSAYILLPLAAAGALASGWIAMHLLPHVRQRIDIWLDPFAATTGAGWQLLQSLAALYNGGLLGAGFGEGAPQTIPVASSDFIYAAIGEELGLIGCLLLTFVFAMLIKAGFRIAANCSDRFGTLLATALTASLAIQITLNIGGVTKALPMTGVPLPFLSHGGTSLVISFAAVGLLASIAASNDRRKPPRRKTKR